MCGQVRLESLNRKVIGAKKHIYKDIEFDSKLEIACYQALESSGMPFEYNKEKVELIPKFRLNKVHYYQALYAKKKFVAYKEYHTSKNEKQSFTNVTYTPDFRLLFGNYLIYIETKGNPNDVYPYKRRMFLKKLEDLSERFPNSELYFFEPRGVKQVKETIAIIKNLYETNRENKAINKESIMQSLFL